MLSQYRKLWSLFTRRERWQVAVLAAMVVSMGLAQVAGVGTVAPFVRVLVDPDAVQANAQLRWLFEGLGFESTNLFLVLLAGVVLAAFAVANGFLILTQWMLIRFGWNLQYRLSRRLLDAYLAQPYTAFLQRNSADTGKNILSEVERLSGGVVLPLLRLVAFSVAGLFLIGALFWVNALLSLLVTAVLVGSYAGVYGSIRRVLTRAGERRILANTHRFKVISEAFGGIKETKVLGRESALLDQYDGPARRFAEAQSTAEVISQLPGYALQFIALAALMMMTLVLMGPSGGTIQEAAPLLAVYLFGAQRLLPFLLGIYQNAIQLRFNRVAVDVIYDDMATRSATNASVDAAIVSGEQLMIEGELRLDEVTFRYPGASKPAIEDVTVTIPRRSFVAFVGATGAGKTTLVDIILGLLEPDEGTLTVDNNPIEGPSIRRWQNNLGYVPQDIYLADDSIAANIAFGIHEGERDQDAIESAARVANIHEFIVDELPNSYQTLVGERGVRLSGGQRQRIGIARALYHNPEVLVLDEATSNLDQGTEAAVHQAIERAAAAKTVILIAHRLVTTKYCDRIFVLDRGRLVDQGTYDDLLVSSEHFRSIAGVGHLP
jgi:ABC-type multidrug transport system fused ATPase/permease subunit